ncbi:hypothetical protein CSC62_13965 [Pseudoxanthomonas jiangsuensis]|uniref:hypothetical protein n=1 Tax=Pseudoxanthomonas jiangsuensis TaxID=619688 RepID=UPI001391693A|nr:hypothetical protein [Pseudoxanthomonas jiangsuensis]KAF1692736.1 hypothetical protein CSC62_13965 [Pseudoxanthomonas jiangsuensis]
MPGLNNPASARFNGLLKAAMGALHLLDERGLCVRDIRLSGSRPVFEIDPPPAGGFLRGAMRRRETFNGVTRMVMATAFHDCQVEWEITEHHQPARPAGVARG